MTTKLLYGDWAVEIDGVRYRHHPHGCGLVAEDAEVAQTAYIGPGVIIGPCARILDDVRLEGNASVSGAVELRENVCMRDHAHVKGPARIAGNLKLSGDTEIAGTGRGLDLSGDGWLDGTVRVTGSGTRTFPPGRILKGAFLVTRKP